MPKDLRTFLQQIHENNPDEYVEIEKTVDPLFELTQVLQKFQSLGRNPAVVFNHVEGSRHRVVSNVNASLRKLAAAFDSDEQNMMQEYIKREANLIPPIEVVRGLVQEIVMTDEAVDLGLLPIVKNCVGDSGPFVNAGATISKDPELGHFNSGIYRMQVHDKTHLGFCIEPHNKVSHIFNKYESKGEPMEIACVLGHHPACIIASQSKLPFGTDTYAIMGALLKEPIRLVKAKTVNLMVPADAEIVIEGKILPKVRKDEGPYGEYTWTYGPAKHSPVFEVTGITMRRDAIYQHVFAARRDHNYTALLPRMAIIYNKVKAAIPSLRAVHMPIGGLCRFVAYISIKKEFEGAGKNAALVALGSDPFIKQVVVVDDDINIFDETDVLWAIATRTQPDRAIFMIPEAAGSWLDPSSYTIVSRAERGLLNTKWAIDATKPLAIPFQERAEVAPGWEKIDLDAYVKSR